ncbi:lipid-A-disaccharide synthase [Thorsellia anophelis]|uniref:Lipid-A-disaccharide synthase n=1 Tax=Thorsellia anophelis DSM 18579 TaxID=1123402 RepID=A0A1H9YRD5_9GAMM|nr:lipid-A-disaccharide synthase [Thorsellia anophelis]SES71651.1 lipid-A-disaccharide synthase [Thorsellia anophelis DSM 18579]
MQSQEDKPIIIGLVAGEVSGDILGAGLIAAIKQQYNNVRFVGIAGPRMKAMGCEAWYEMEELAVMGVVEVLARLPRLLSIRRDLVKRFTELKPDVFVGIDAPDFNLTLESKLKQSGIKTVQYVSPSVWAWRQKRIFKIAKATHLVLALLPFEKAFYDKFEVPCLFVGHTLADKLPLEPDKNGARNRLKLEPEGLYLAILPGSRHAEITLLTPVFLQAAEELLSKIPNLKFIVPMVNETKKKAFLDIKAKVAPNLPLTVFEGKSTDVLTSADATLLASGTATLECMLAKSPMVVGYKMRGLNYFIGKRLVKTPFISLPNLLANKQVVLELLQDDCIVSNIVNGLTPLLSDVEHNNALKSIFRDLHLQIRCNADEKAAQAVLSLVQTHTT